MLKKQFFRLSCNREVIYHSNGLVTFRVTTPLGKYTIELKEITKEEFHFYDSLDDHSLLRYFCEYNNIIQNY